ncbi:MAG: glycosyltransferase family 2 protein [Chloroflexi bacterium]|nr:glycosyltransferase family 2 protein [Chloroflexota bacterium]
MAGPYHIVALIPAHDEGPRIAVVVEVTAQHLPVVVVDDGSADDTAAQAEAAGATVLRQAPNAGKGAALRAGFRFALDSGFEAVVTLDADGQHDPSEIPRFLEAYAAQAADRPGLIIVGDASRRCPLHGASPISWAAWSCRRPSVAGSRTISPALD